MRKRFFLPGKRGKRFLDWKQTRQTKNVRLLLFWKTTETDQWIIGFTFWIGRKKINYVFIIIIIILRQQKNFKKKRRQHMKTKKKKEAKNTK